MKQFKTNPGLLVLFRIISTSPLRAPRNFPSTSNCHRPPPVDQHSKLPSCDQLDCRLSEFTPTFLSEHTSVVTIFGKTFKKKSQDKCLYCNHQCQFLAATAWWNQLDANDPPWHLDSHLEGLQLWPLGLQCTLWTTAARQARPLAGFKSSNPAHVQVFCEYPGLTPNIQADHFISRHSWAK